MAKTVITITGIAEVIVQEAQRLASYYNDRDRSVVVDVPGFGLLEYNARAPFNDVPLPTSVFINLVKTGE